MLQRQGGSFPLTADVNFGSSFGLIAPYYKSHSSNIASSGVIRLAVGDTIDWRNNANSANNVLSINGSDQLLYNGVVVGAAGGVTSLNSLTGALNIVGTTDEIVVTSSSPNITISTPQAINTTSSPTFVTVTANLTGNVTGNLTGTVTGHSTLDLALTGGTMSGAIAMGSNKITGLALATTSGDAMPFNQVNAFPSGIIIGGNTTGDSGYGTITKVTNSHYYEGTFSATFTGPFTASQTINYTVVGRTVTINVANFTGTSTAATFFTSGIAVPVNLRPAVGYSWPVVIENSSTVGNSPGLLAVGSGGDINIFVSLQSGNFGGSGTAGLINNVSISWQIGI